MTKYDDNLSTQEVYRRRMASETVQKSDSKELANQTDYEKGMRSEIYRLQMEWTAYGKTYPEGTYWAVVYDDKNNIVSVYPMITVVNGNFDKAIFGNPVGIGKLDDMGYDDQKIEDDEESLLKGFVSFIFELLVVCSFSYLLGRMLRKIFG